MVEITGSCPSVNEQTPMSVPLFVGMKGFYPQQKCPLRYSKMSMQGLVRM